MRHLRWPEGRTPNMSSPPHSSPISLKVAAAEVKSHAQIIVNQRIAVLTIRIVKSLNDNSHLLFLHNPKCPAVWSGRLEFYSSVKGDKTVCPH